MRQHNVTPTCDIKSYWDEDEQPKVTNYYVYGLGLLYEITETVTGTNTLFYHYDLRGSTVALTDASGNVTDRIEYSAYGLMTCRTGTNDTPFLFNGRYGVQTDPNGLLYMRARYYNPYICRFLNPDPIGFAGGLNFYAYADGNPVSLIDPFGLCAESAGFFSWIGQAALGFGEGAWETASGLASAVWNIDQTVAGLWDAATHPLQTVDALSVALAEYADRALGGDPEAIGRGVFELAAMAVPASKLKYAKYVDNLADLGSAARTGTELVLRNPITQHAAHRLAERGITEKMVQVAINKGQKFYDVKRGTYHYVLEQGFASGKTLQVGVDPMTGNVTTAIRSTHWNPNVTLPDGSVRFIRIE